MISILLGVLICCFVIAMFGGCSDVYDFQESHSYKFERMSDRDVFDLWLKRARTWFFYLSLVCAGVSLICFGLYLIGQGVYSFKEVL